VGYSKNASSVSDRLRLSSRGLGLLTLMLRFSVLLLAFFEYPNRISEYPNIPLANIPLTSGRSVSLQKKLVLFGRISDPMLDQRVICSVKTSELDGFVSCVHSDLQILGS